MAKREIRRYAEHGRMTVKQAGQRVKELVEAGREKEREQEREKQKA